MRASFGDGKVAPELVARKEAVALGRLNESVPPSPFVVRLSTLAACTSGGGPVTPGPPSNTFHGGVEGTTLEDRVTYSLHKTGYAFEPSRAAHAIRCLRHSGSRRSTPLASFTGSLARQRALLWLRRNRNLQNLGLRRGASGRASEPLRGAESGTLGYSAPESSNTTAGPYSDVFSFATVVFYLLTGQHYFDADTPMEASACSCRSRARASPRTPRCVRSCSSVPRRARPSMLRSPAQPPGPLQRPATAENSAPRSCLGSVRRPRVPSRANDSCRPYVGPALRLRGVSTDGHPQPSAR